MASATRLRVYSLGPGLLPEEAAEVQSLLGRPIEQVRLPSVLPAPDSHRGHADRPLCDSGAIARLLRRAGIGRDAGCHVGLVAPADPHWHVAAMEAIRKATGFLPFVIQTHAQRAAIGNPGDLRILDAQGLAAPLR